MISARTGLLLLSFFACCGEALGLDAPVRALDVTSTGVTTTVVFKAERPGARPFLLIPVFHALFFAEPRLSKTQSSELAKSKVIYREIDDTDGPEVAGITADFRSLSPMPAFSDVVAARYRERLSRLPYFNEDGARLTNLLAAHPYFLTEKVGEICAGAISPGNEAFLLEELKTKAQVRSLEDGPVLVQQIRALSPDDWLAQLRYNVTEAEDQGSCIEQSQRFYQASTLAYLHWDVDLIRDIFDLTYLAPRKPRASPGIITSDDRNSNFISRIEATSDVPERVFLIGAVHFGGPKGLVQALRAKAFRISEVR